MHLRNAGGHHSSEEMRVADHARYNLLLAISVAPFLLALVFLAIIARPIMGGLTHLGGYLEEQFGSNDPQYGYVQPAFNMAKGLNQYDKYYDVVVIGDSFSLNEEIGWQNVLHEKTGLSIISFATSGGFGPRGFNLEALVNSRQFQEHPPLYLVYESVERKAVAHLKRYQNMSLDSDKYHQHDNGGRKRYTLKPVTMAKRQLEKSPPVQLEQRMHFAGNYLFKLLSRLMGRVGKTRSFSLVRGDLFSNGLSDILLVTDEDVYKPTLNEGDGVQVARGLHNLEKLVQRNGVTKFMLMLFPDKLSTYTPYLRQPELATQNYLPYLANYYEFPRIDIAYQKALIDGVKDLYLPNDTHTGYMGHRVATEELVRFYFYPDSGDKQ